MKVFRAIYRLDYVRNYDMINRPGTVGQLIQDANGVEYFDFYGEDRSARRILVRRLLEDEGRYRSLTVEPTAIVCDIERTKGLEIEALDEDPDFSALCAIASGLLKEFGISRFERMGLRLFMFGSSAGGLAQARKRFKTLAQPSLVDQIGKTLGPISDLGYSFDGISESKVGYHFRVGPFLGTEELQKYFSNINNLLKNGLDGDTVIDLDLFEMKVAYTPAGALKWRKPQLEVAAEMAKRVVDLLKPEMK